MAIGVPNRVGAINAGSSAPATLAAYLDSIGVTWYGGFRRGLGMYSVSANQSTPVTATGIAVGQWVPSWTAGGFTARFIQDSNSKRPSYRSVYGTTGLQGDATTCWLYLDSTTALNRDHTVLISATSLADGGALYSQSISNMRFSIPGSMSTQAAIYAAAATGMSVKSVLEMENINGTTAKYRIGWRSSGTSHYNAAPNLMRLSNGSLYTEACVTEVWLVGALLTTPQILTCLPCMVQ